MSTDHSTKTEYYDLGQVVPADFEAQLNTEFEVDLRFLGMEPDGSPRLYPDAYPANQTALLKLVEVTRREQVSPHLRAEPFTLLFVGGHDQPLYNDQHVLRHKVLGNVVVLLTNVNATPGVHPEQHPDGRFYEVVFN